jgi:hypothetical protein
MGGGGQGFKAAVLAAQQSAHTLRLDSEEK